MLYRTDVHTDRFLRNLFRRNLPSALPEPGMMMINLATAAAPAGDPVMSGEDLAVFIAAFEKAGFIGSINWYRNMDRNSQCPRIPTTSTRKHRSDGPQTGDALTIKLDHSVGTSQSGVQKLDLILMSYTIALS